EVLAGVDVKGRAGFRVQRAKSDELGVVTSRPGGPILPSQIIEQRQSLFDFFEVLSHGRVFASRDEGRRTPAAFPGKDGRRRGKFLSGGGARGPAEQESAKTGLRDSPDRAASANERRGPVCGAGRNEVVAQGPGRGPSGGGWRDRARD